MPAKPQISVQLVHIQGPLKGQIQSFNQSEIRIGRHPDCEVQFPKDVVTISRQHARIVRVDNRFKLIDQSTNGTYVNGQSVSEAFLKDGDVITFAEGGPKVSFLTQAVEGQSRQRPEQPQQEQAPPVPPSPAAPAHQTTPEMSQTPPSSMQRGGRPPSSHGTADADQVAIEPVKAPLAIQFGASLKSFQQLPITVGKGDVCDFTINHPALNDQHAQFFFAQGKYWIKDLTGSYSITLNGAPIQNQAALETDMTIALTDHGPRFRFLGSGRLAEIEEPSEQKPAPSSSPASADDQPAEKPEKAGKTGSLFKKFFR